MKMILIGLNAGAIDLYLNNVGINSIHCGAEGLVEHEERADDNFVPQSAHEGPIPESAKTMRSQSTEAVTDVTRFAVEGEENSQIQ